MTTPVDRSSWRSIDDAGALSAIVGEPLQRATDKVRPALGPRDLQWLAASPFCVLASADADGSCDASPKGDPAGSLVRALD